MNITKNLREMRATYGLSQEDIAGAIGVARSTVVSIEQGKRELTSDELAKLADFLGMDLYELLSEELPDYDKYKEMLIYALRSGADKHGKINKTNLAKILYLADFSWYYKHLQPMSGMKYKRLQYGPVPDQYFRIVDELLDSKILKLEVLSKGAQRLSLTEVGKSIKPEHLRSAEVGLIEKIGEKWKDKTTDEIVDFTHQQLPWQICRPNEYIPYELITQEEPENVY